MMNIVIFGAPGSGKGTQSEKLIEKYGLYHISTGDLLRQEIKAGSELGKIADGYISKGQLLPDSLIIDMLAKLLDTTPETRKGVIFDGFPRTIPQAEALEALLRDRGMELSAVVGLEVDEPELIDRLLKRGQVSGRSDDNLETIKKRLDVYHNQTTPLKEFYIANGKYKAIHGMGSVDSIFETITSALDGCAC